MAERKSKRNVVDIIGEDIFQEAFSSSNPTPAPEDVGEIVKAEVIKEDPTYSETEEIARIAKERNQNEHALSDLVRDMKTRHAKRMNDVLDNASDRDFAPAFIKVLSEMAKIGLLQEENKEEDKTVKVEIMRGKFSKKNK